MPTKAGRSLSDKDKDKDKEKDDSDSTRTTGTTGGGIDMKRDNSALTTKDVDLTVQSTPGVSSELQSLVTQVQRDDNHAPVIRRTTTQDEIPPFNLHKDNRPQSGSSTNTQNVVAPRSFASRMLCCFPKSTTTHQDRQIGMVVPSNSSSFYLGAKKSSFGSYRSNPSMQSMDPQSQLPFSKSNQGKKYLALDLDETLVHSSFQPVDNASFVISVVIEGVVHNVFVIKRPGVDQFLERLAKHYELIVYTASLSKYADPLLDILDPKKTISRRLFRENCVFYDGHYVKDLSVLDKDISQSIIVDNSPMSYIFHPENAIDCTSFFDDPKDVEMWQIADFLEHIHGCDDVRAYCKYWREWCRTNHSTVPEYMKNKR